MRSTGGGCSSTMRSQPTGSPMSDIATRQNTPEFLELIHAATSRYRVAKRVALVQLAVAVLAPVALGAVGVMVPGLVPWSAAFGVAVVILDPFLLRRMRKKARREGALAQESFDCGLFGLPWSLEAAGPRPRLATVKEWARDRRGDPHARLINWYSPVIANLPIEVGRVACQRINAAWDVRLRRRYAWLVVGAAALMGVSVLTWGLVADQTVSVALQRIAGLAPAFAWCFREWQDQRDLADDREALGERVEELWNASLMPSSDSAALVTRVRRVQDQLFAQRRDGPEVLDWIYRVFRQRDERHMDDLAVELVAEYTDKRAR